MRALDLGFDKSLSIGINIAIFVLFAICSFVLINKLKLDQKGYKYLFLVYTFFWIPIMLVRPYRGTMQNAIDKDFLTIVLAVYGGVGIFIRVFADAINYIFKYRKAFLYFCAVAQFVLFLPVVIAPNTPTNILEAIGIGIGASCIGTYELLFREQYGNKKAFLTVSVLSIPPLLANFLTAPVQSIMKTVATIDNKTDPNILRWLWFIALVFVVITFVMLFFLKERSVIKGMENNNKLHLEKNNSVEWVLFLFLALIGSTIAFVKFTNSDAVATLHLQNLAKLNNTSSASYEGYLSVVFSVFQLVAGVLIGMYLIRKINVIWIFIIGSSSWIVYSIAVSFISNPIGYISIHGINGFGYGILYNLVLAIVLRISLDNKVVTKMGLYQSILAIGITGSSFYTTWIKEEVLKKQTENDPLSQYMHAYLVQNMILVGVIGLITIAFVILMIIVQTKMKNFTIRDEYSSNKVSVPKINKKQ